MERAAADRDSPTPSLRALQPRFAGARSVIDWQQPNRVRLEVIGGDIGEAPHERLVFRKNLLDPVRLSALGVVQGIRAGSGMAHHVRPHKVRRF